MKKIITNDGSVSFLNEEINEAYHSTSGALEESFEKFAKPCSLKDGMKVLDICFGIGYNSLAAISLADVSIVALEKDLNILKEIKNIEVPEELRENYGKIKSFVEDFIKNQENTEKINNEKGFNGGKSIEKVKIQKNSGKNPIKKEKANEIIRYEDKKRKITLIIGDARQTIKSLNEKFDAVFLDPFSQKKCPELWTKEFFDDIFRLMDKNTVLTTYSCARIVRDSLKAAGFEVKDGPAIGRRSPATIAIKN
ncbi:hypothetical protein J4212_01275 [Candidatus Woesearchaeota archaeon]|nr:hypothetical protein [Candidatus Woesearchaeota archaeon]